MKKTYADESFLFKTGGYMGYNIFLPVVRNSSNNNKSCRVGAQIEGGVNSTWIVPNRIYECPIRWNDCETIQGQYTWPSYLFQNISQLGNQVIIGTKTCPSWARLWEERPCSPPKVENYEDYAKWICKIIETFNPWGIELWNEPDCSFSNSAPEQFGCWYDDLNWYNSGKMYGEFTSFVYGYVKTRHPLTNIIVGALMMVNETQSFEFFRGAKQNGLKGDFLSFHGYITERSYFDRIFGIARKLRTKTSLAILCTETSVLSWEDSDELKILQRDYLEYINNNILSSELEYALWYTLSGNGWKNSDLQRGSVSTPAWNLFRDL